MQPFELEDSKGFFYWEEVDALTIGAIICIAGEIPETWSENDEADFRKQVNAFDAIRVLPSRANVYQLTYLWLDLISNGMTEIVILSAEFSENRRLNFSRRLLRLPIMELN